MLYDVLIIGASAAGVSAAIYLARRNVKFAMIAKDFGGEVATSGEIGNYPGLPETNGLELVERFSEHLKKYNVSPILGEEVTSIERRDGFFCVSKKSGSEKAADKMTSGGKRICDYEARAVIIATGLTPRPLDVPGDKEYRNKGVTYCTTCDGPLFKGKVTATIGGGNSALESSLMMAAIAEKHYVINKNPQFKGEAIYIEKLKTLPNVEIVYNAKTTEILGDEKFVTGLKYQDSNLATKQLNLDGVMVHIGMIPNSSFVPPEVEKNAIGEIKVNAKCGTSVPGIYAAGDVTDIPYKQISLAVGQGTIAALAAIEYLNKLESRK